MPKASFDNTHGSYKSSSANLGKMGSATAGTGHHAVRIDAEANENRVHVAESHDNPSQKHFGPRRGRSGQVVTLRSVPEKEVEITESAAGKLNIQQDQPDNPAF